MVLWRKKGRGKKTINQKGSSQLQDSLALVILPCWIVLTSLCEGFSNQAIRFYHDFINLPRFPKVDVR